MNITLIISTADPINGVYISDLNNRPHAVKGDKAKDQTICFENSATRQTWQYTKESP